MILVVTSVFVSNIVAYAEEPSGGLKVTATSNYFPKKSTFVANSEEYVTVTYFINSSKDMLGTQWELKYDPTCLEFNNAVNMNGAGDDLNLMPSVDDLVWKVITNEETGEQTGRIEANAHRLKLYKFAGKGYIPFVTATFKVIGSGETTVDLFVDILTLSRLGSNFMTDPAEEEVIVDFGVINVTHTVPSRETAVHSGLYDPHCDITAPVISGIENGKTYCDTVEFEVSDNVGVASVKAGDVELSPTNGKYTLEKGIGTVKVVATDKSDNTAEVTVTVNDGHTWNNGVCSVCDYTCVHKDDSSNHTGGTEIRGAKDATCTEEGYTGDTYCKGCGVKLSTGSSTNKLSHDLVNTPAKDATAAETGNKEYWHCKDCGKYFADEKGTNEIKPDDTVIPKLPPEIIKGKGQSITTGEKKALSFTSNAAFNDFIQVELDGKTLDETDYTAREGSTVATLKDDYVATLSVGEHTIGIVSESGTAVTTFTVKEKMTADNEIQSPQTGDKEIKSPQTGDNSSLFLWTALLFISTFGVLGRTIYCRRKRA